MTLMAALDGQISAVQPDPRHARPVQQQRPYCFPIDRLQGAPAVGISQPLPPRARERSLEASTSYQRNLSAPPLRYYGREGGEHVGLRRPAAPVRGRASARKR